MSEVGWYKSAIRVSAHPSSIEASPCFEILRQSLELVARERGGRLSNHVTDALGRRTACDIAVVMSDLTHGVGVNVDRKSGRVSFLYDASGGYDARARAVTEEITQNYVGIALARTMRSLGYTVEEQPSERPGSIVLVGRM